MTRRTLHSTLPAAALALLAAGALAFAGALPAQAVGTISGTGIGETLVPASSPTIAVGHVPQSIVFSPDGTRAYESNLSDHTVDQIDTATGTVIGTAQVGINPSGLAMAPDGGHVYVANYSDNDIDVIDTATLAVTPLPFLIQSPRAIAISHDGTHLYFESSPSTFYSWDLTTSTLSWSATVQGNLVNAIVPNADDSTVYLTGGLTGIVTAVDTATQATHVITMPAGAYPWGAALSPDGSTLWVSDDDNNTIDPIDTATDTVGTPIPVGAGPVGLALSPNGEYLYIAETSGIQVMRTRDGAVVDAHSANTPISVAVSPDGRTVYLTDNSAMVLHVFHPLALTVSGNATAVAGDAATFHIAMDDGNSPVGDYSAATVTVALLDASDTVVAQSDGTAALDPTTGAVDVTVPTDGVPAGSYRVAATWDDATNPFEAIADGFSVTAADGGGSSAGGGTAALAETGVDALPWMLAGAGLLVIGGVLLALRLVRRRRTSPVE